MFKTMFYAKNVPMWERAFRVVLGLALVAYAILGHPSLFVAVVSLASAVFVIATGFIGWCPMCAMVGRKIKSE